MNITYQKDGDVLNIQLAKKIPKWLKSSSFDGPMGLTIIVDYTSRALYPKDLDVNILAIEILGFKQLVKK